MDERECSGCHLKPCEICHRCPCDGCDCPTILDEDDEDNTGNECSESPDEHHCFCNGNSCCYCEWREDND